MEVWAVVAGDDSILKERPVRVEETCNLMCVVSTAVGVYSEDVEGVGLEEEGAEGRAEAAPVTEEAVLVENVEGVDLEPTAVQVLGARIDGGVKQGQVNVKNQVKLPSFCEGFRHVSVDVGSFMFGDGDVMTALNKDPRGFFCVACFLF